MDQDATWHAGRPRHGHIVLDGEPVPLPQMGTAPQFSAHICCGQMAGWIKMPQGMNVGLSPGNFVLNGDPVPLPRKGAEPPPQFSPHFYCGQTAGCIKMPLGMEVGLSPGDFVLDGNPAPLSKKGAEPLILCPCLLWPRSSISDTAEQLSRSSLSLSDV